MVYVLRKEDDTKGPQLLLLLFWYRVSHWTQSSLLGHTDCPSREPLALKLEVVSINFHLAKRISFLFKYVHKYSVIPSLDVRQGLRECLGSVTSLCLHSGMEAELPCYCLLMMSMSWETSFVWMALFLCWWLRQPIEKREHFYRLPCWLLLEKFVPSSPIPRS